MTLTLYRRDGCELCDEAEALLREIGAPPCERIQIGWFGPHVAAYGHRVPVLRRDDGTEIDWPFDRERLLAFLGR
jgi:Glutaredoxin-like domain (DUF836)